MSTPHPLANHRNLTALLSTRATPELKKEMKAAAKAKGLSLSIAVRDASIEWTERNRVSKRK